MDKKMSDGLSEKRKAIAKGFLKAVAAPVFAGYAGGISARLATSWLSIDNEIADPILFFATLASAGATGYFLGKRSCPENTDTRHSQKNSTTSKIIKGFLKSVAAPVFLGYAGMELVLFSNLAICYATGTFTLPPAVAIAASVCAQASAGITGYVFSKDGEQTPRKNDAVHNTENRTPTPGT